MTMFFFYCYPLPTKEGEQRIMYFAASTEEAAKKWCQDNEMVFARGRNVKIVGE